MWLAWDYSGPAADGFHVWRRSEVTAPWVLVGTVTEKQFPVSLEGMGFYTVSAFNGAGETWAIKQESAEGTEKRDFERLVAPRMKS